jgi:hypothetical protein
MGMRYWHWIGMGVCLWISSAEMSDATSEGPDPFSTFHTFLQNTRRFDPTAHVRERYAFSDTQKGEENTLSRILSLSPDFASVYEIENTFFSDPRWMRLMAQRKGSFPLAEETLLQSDVDLGRALAGRLLRFYGTSQQPALTHDVNQRMQSIVERGDAPLRPYMLAILNSSHALAFACPGGYLLITNGLLLELKREGEITALLQHAMLQLSQRSFASTLRQLSAKELEKEAERIEEGQNFEPYEETLVRERPLPTDVSALQVFLTKYIMGDSAAGVNAILEEKVGLYRLIEQNRLGYKFSMQRGLQQQSPPTAGEESNPLFPLQKSRE